MALAGRLAVLVERMVRKFGRAVVVRRPTQSFTAGTGSVTTTWSDFPAKAVVETVDLRAVDGTATQAGDRLLLVAASEVTTAPADGWTVVLGESVGAGDVLRVVRVETIEVEGSPVAYRLQARG